MVKNVVAFDIDGTLTDKKVRERFRELEDKDDVIAGIVTSNPPLAANSFIAKYELSPDFQQSALIKARALLGIGMTYRPENKVYVGNSTTDALYSRLSNWDFVNPNDAKQIGVLAAPDA